MAEKEQKQTPEFESFEFPLGAALNVVTDTGALFAGTLVGLRHNPSVLREQFLFLRLTADTDPYTTGEIVALNVTLITSIGPVTAA